MKTCVFLGVILLVACVQVNAQSSQSFVEDFNTFFHKMLSLQQNPSYIDTLSIKIEALNAMTMKYGVSRRPYHSIFDVLNSIGELRRKMLTPELGLEKISGLLDDFDFEFDELNMQRDVDESVLPSKINDLVDEFVNRYIKTVTELFDNMYEQTKHLNVEAEKLTDESSTLLDTFAENIEKCLAIPKTEYKEIYQCHQNTRGVLPALAHNSALLNVIAKDLQELDTLQMNGKTSVYQLYYDMRSESSELLQQIREVRDQREAEKDNKPTENSKY